MPASSPGFIRRDLHDEVDDPKFTRLLLPEVEVIAVGDTTVLSTTTTDATGAQTTEQIPKTLLTLSVSQDEAERTIYASRNATLSFGLPTDKSVVNAAASPSAPCGSEGLNHDCHRRGRFRSAEALQSAVGSGTVIVPGLEQLRGTWTCIPASTP